MKKKPDLWIYVYPNLKKLIMELKIAVIITLISVTNVLATTSYSQSAKVSLDLKDTRLEKVMDDIEQQSEFYFIFNQKQIDVNRIVNIQAENKLISEILPELFKGTNVNYAILDRKILLTTDPIENSLRLIIPETELQQLKITGVVTDANTGEILPGANILVKGTTQGVISDINGKYDIVVDDAKAVLVFSFVGYLSEEKPVSGQTVINVQLSPDIRTLEQVIVIGYGTVRKSDLTGSVATVSSDKLNDFPATSVLQALQGKVAGLTITSNNGAPGSSSTIRIRGGSSISYSSEPLWVVDGFPGAPQPQPEDIKSIEVLRDASSTAIFGSRGSNGVIIVTTKKGNTGGLKVEASTSYGIDEVTRLYDVMSGPEYGRYVNAWTAFRSPALPAPFGNPDTLITTDWQDLVFRQGSLAQYNVSVSGGKDNLRIYSSVKYSKQEGIVINSNNEFFTGKLNLDANVSNKLSVGMHLDYSHYTNNQVSSQTWYTGTGGISGTAVVFEPWLGIRDANGVYTTSIHGYASDNPYANAAERKNQNVGDNVSTNLFADYEIIKGLKLSANLQLSFTSSRIGGYTPSVLVRNTSNSTASMSTSRGINLNQTTYLTYDKTLAGIHHLTVMAGHDYQKMSYEGFTAEAKYLLSDGFNYWGLGTASTALSPSSYTGERVMEGMYGRLNYTLMDKYTLTSNLRYDGASQLGKNNKWVLSPSAAVAWNITKEAFMQGISAISDLRFHAGYGAVPNANVEAYSSLATLTMNGVYKYINGARVNAVIPASVANDDLHWEQNIMTNIGIDLGLFNGKMSFTAEWYNNETKDMLYSNPLPGYTGYSSMQRNFGNFRNRGVEFTLGANLSDKAFKWISDFNISFNRTTVVTLPFGDWFIGNSPLSGSINPFILREGESTNSFWGYVYDGVYQEGDDFYLRPAAQPGFEKYKDIDGKKDAEGKLTGQPDSLLNTSDQRIIGCANPDFTFGWTNDFRYRGFDLNIQITGSYGNEAINCTRMELENMSEKKNQLQSAFEKSWTPTNTNTDIPMAGTNTQYTFSSRWVEDASYLRVQNVALGYTLPSSVVNMLKISKCRFYVSIQNALLFTKYSGYDPEINWNPGNYTNYSNICRGLDYDAYPRARRYTMGLQVTF
jgi:TonB-linked SusC/RagA family outer membrane protein